MKRILYLITMCTTLFLASCDEFLERTPLDEITEPEFWKTVSDLELYANGFYQNFPGWASVGNGYSTLPDNGTDIGLASAANSRLNGTSSIPTSTTASLWSWDEVREVNYFISNMDKAEGLEADLDQYKGEGYFFRAYYYYLLLKDYGDLPIYTEYFDNLDTDALYRARSPRNEVVDFILSDLDLAISLLQTRAEVAPRVSIEAAQLLKATIALYEGTWEKYHNGTDFGVAGSTGTSYLEQAAEAAKSLIDGGTRTLHSDYSSLFNAEDLSSNSEIILWKQYDWLTFGNSYGNDLQVGWPNQSSYSRFAVRSYLCTDGQPISVSNLYQGDLSLANIETNRDPRLAATIMVPGDVVTINSGVTTYWTGPTFSGTTGSVTAYESQKYRNPLINESTNAYSRNTAKIFMRYAEALLIYAEAKAELGTITQSDLDISINKLRDRVSMPHLTLGSIVTDPDWPDYGYTITDILQEVRRERTVELMNEGFRLDDLMRWRAHNLFAAQRPRGAYYETLIYNISKTRTVDADNYLDPYLSTLSTAGYGFNPDRNYLLAIPSDELFLNSNLTQNPGWE